MKVAVELLSVPVPIVAPPSLKVTVPVSPFEIVAVKVTAVPTAEGFRELDRVSVGVVVETVSVTGLEVTGL